MLSEPVLKPLLKILWQKLIFITGLTMALGYSHMASADRSTNYDHGTSVGERTTGLGVVFGEPTGPNAKFWLASRNAVDVGVAFSFSSFILVYSDYLLHFPGAFNHNSSTVGVIPYIGVGAELFLAQGTTNDRWFFQPNDNRAALGIRIPLGIEWLLNDIPLGVFGEIVPGVGVVPGTFAYVEAGLGLRYYF